MNSAVSFLTVTLLTVALGCEPASTLDDAAVASDGSPDAEALAVLCEGSETYGVPLVGPAELGAGPLEGRWVGNSEIQLRTATMSAFGIGDVTFEVRTRGERLEVRFGDPPRACRFDATRSATTARLDADQRCEGAIAIGEPSPWTVCGGELDATDGTLRIEGVVDHSAPSVWAGARVDVLRLGGPIEPLP